MYAQSCICEVSICFLAIEAARDQLMHVHSFIIVSILLVYTCMYNEVAEQLHHSIHVHVCILILALVSTWNDIGVNNHHGKYGSI